MQVIQCRLEVQCVVSLPISLHHLLTNQAKAEAKQPR